MSAFDQRCYKTGAEGSRMADDVQDIWLKEFEELGEDQVRAQQVFGGSRIRRG